ncbi:unnamed protein product [Larinioides sclopetarius]|uniref:RRM domain-containing protein n=1 Tax=Larinioides sclopetarius TaxID=280406 RepID=A0AAV1ZQN9_9ARAC
MVNTHRVQQERRKEQDKGYDEEKKIPKLVIRLGKEPKIVSNSDEENSSNLISRENVGSFNTSIADKVKLRKRGQGTTSDAELFKTISLSSLPEKKRKRKNSSSVVPSKLSSNSPLSGETCKEMFQSDSNVVPSLTSELRKTKVTTVPFNDLMQCPSLNYKPCSTFDDTFIENTNVNSYNLPSKRAKVLENYSLDTDNKPSAALSLLDIHQLEVASYEEVSSVEPLHTTFSSLPVPLYFFGVNNAANIMPSTNMLQGINSISLTKDEKKPVLNTEKTNCTHSEVCSNFQNKAADVSLLHHDYLETIDISATEDIEILLKKENDLLDSPMVAEYFFHLKERAEIQKSSNDTVDKIIDLAFELEKQRNSRVISSKDIRVFVLSKYKPYIQARDALKNKINSRDSVKIETKQLSRYSTDHPLSSKSHVRDYKSTHDINGVFKQESQATKEKRKAMGERCIVYVGNIPHGYSVLQLKNRFKRFGAIRDIQIKSKIRGDLNSSDGHFFGSEGTRNYGFITFSCNQEASNAIEGGNKGHKLQFHLSFGARRQFVGEEYKDLDGIVAKNENSIYKCYSRSSFLPQKKEEDYDIVLKNAMAARGVKPQPFRMKCKA